MALTIDTKQAVRYVDSFDATPICYTVFGDGERVLFLAPGLGTPILSYKYIIERLAPHMRVIAWDMRGGYRSGVPERGLAGLGVEDHAGDLLAIAEQEGLTHFSVGGWSMAVQVSLEFYHQHPQMCDALLLINGPYENVLEHAFFLPGAYRAVDAGLAVAQRLGGVVTPSVRYLLGKQWAMRAIRAAQIVTTNMPFFLEVVQEFRNLEFGLYFGMMRRLNEHSARDYLEDVEVPTLITAGTKDVMTPVRLARTMADAIPHARLVIVPNGTHYTPIEFPDLLADEVADFLAGVYPETASAFAVGG